MKPIFLDFMCPDAWKTYSTIPDSMSVAQKNRLICELKRSVNYAVLLSESYCILPPAFILQSNIVYTVIRELRRYLEYDEIRMPLKETSIDAYIAKKINEYRYVKKDYQGFYKRDEAEEFLNEYRYSIIQRSASMGSSIAANWIQLPDNSPIWRPVISSIPKKADRIRLAPSLLKSRGISITLEAILKHEKIRPLDSVKFAINQAIQHEYIGGYLKEYNANIISNIPPKPILLNYNIAIESQYFDYSFLIRVLRKVGGDPLIELLANMSPEDIHELKNTSDFLYVREYYRQHCDNTSKQIFAKIEDIHSEARCGYTHINTIDGFMDFLKRAADMFCGKSVSNAIYTGGGKSMAKHKKTLFISYQSSDSPVVDIIVDAIQAKIGAQIEISRYTGLDYKDSFKRFMNGIEDHDYVICIVSDRYLKSVACMYEVGETVKSHHFKDKLLHIVLKSDDAKYYSDPNDLIPADVFSYLGRLAYTTYWKVKYDELKKEIENIGDYKATREGVQMLSQIGHIRDDIQVFTEYLSDYNAKTFEELKNNEFADIISAMGF